MITIQKAGPQRLFNTLYNSVQQRAQTKMVEVTWVNHEMLDIDTTERLLD
jgi:hypothetical protein